MLRQFFLFELMLFWLVRFNKTMDECVVADVQVGQRLIVAQAV